MLSESGEDRPGERGGAAGALRTLAESRVGHVVGDRWRLESVIGVGGTASVYAARHRNGREAALKVLHPELARDVRSRKRFLREAYAANRVGHPGAVAVIDDGELPDGTPFLLLELISGQPLGDFVKDGARLPVSEVVAIGIGILDVLAAAHDAGVVHRDIKPSNVIVTPDRRIKVLDFGIAKFHDAQDHDPLVTRSESALGTPAYMSPEQSAGRSAEVDARSDLWSVGATLFSLLTGRFVHDGASSNELLIASATLPARSIATVRSDLPPSVVLAVDRALALDRTRRWPNARAMKATLLGMPEEDPASVITIPEEAPSRAPRRAWPLWIAAAALGVVAIAAVGSLLGLRRAPSLPPPDPSSRPGVPSVAAAVVDVADVAQVTVLAAPSVVGVASARPVRDASQNPKVRALRVDLPAPALTPPPSASSRPASPRSGDALFDRRQ
jgi:eukaryotic-like serine/threonine-protein kinase